ncbi:MAG: hypothetical protein JOS17DRAFT_844904, partial [Linnemannia elongata]
YKRAPTTAIATPVAATLTEDTTHILKPTLVAEPFPQASTKGTVMMTLFTAAIVCRSVHLSGPNPSQELAQLSAVINPHQQAFCLSVARVLGSPFVSSRPLQTGTAEIAALFRQVLQASLAAGSNIWAETMERMVMAEAAMMVEKRMFDVCLCVEGRERVVVVIEIEEDKNC